VEAAALIGRLPASPVHRPTLSRQLCLPLAWCSVHILTDGRDVPDGSSLKFVAELEDVLKELEVRVSQKRQR
jgi:hypothetical protein